MDLSHASYSCASLLTVKHARLRDIPDSCSFNNVSDDKLLDGLVFWYTTGTVGAADGLHMPTAFLGTSVIPSLLSLIK